MDHFQIESTPGIGTHRVAEENYCPSVRVLLGQPELVKLTGALMQERPEDAYQELKYQNQELLRADGGDSRAAGGDGATE